MHFTIKIIIVLIVILFQLVIVFFIDGALSRALVSKHITMENGIIYQLGVDNFVEAKRNYNIALFFSSVILAIIVLWGGGKGKAGDTDNSEKLNKKSKETRGH